jgi:ParB-like chromosome segregation protein Spo0J
MDNNNINKRISYQDFILLKSKEEYEALKNSIKEEGLHLPITINQNGVIIDGHHRYRICEELGIEPIFEVIDFDVGIYEKKELEKLNYKLI